MEYTTPWAGTFTGRKINFDSIDPDKDIELIDIAVGLSNQCRYAGQVWPAYSIAEHCVHLSFQVPEELALKALMHDAPEYVLGDIIRPVKRTIAGYNELEEIVSRAINKKFGLSYSVEDWFVIKEYDDRITINEREKFQTALDRSSYGQDKEPLSGLKLVGLNPLESFNTFVNRFFELSGTAASKEQIGWMSKIYQHEAERNRHTTYNRVLKRIL